ncbi:MAG: tetratricopeptide repeat protein [Chitinophagales bacterium]
MRLLTAFFAFFLSVPLWAQTDDFKYHKSLGLVHYHEKNYLEAIYDLEKAAALNRKDDETLQLLKACHDSLGHHQKNGKSRLETGDRSNQRQRPNVAIPNAGDVKGGNASSATIPRNSRPDAALYKDLFQLGNFFLERSSFDSAAWCYKKYLSANPNDTVAMYYLGASHYFLKRYDAAKEQFQLILQKDPKRSELYNWLGVCELVQNNFIAARDNFKQCILLDPLYAVAYYNLGKTQFELEDIGGATKNLEKALELQETDADVKNILGECYYRNGQWAQAKKMLSEIYESNKKSMRINALLGEIAMKQSEWQAAIDYWDAYLKLNPSALDANKKLGVAYFKLEKYTYSLDCFDKAAKSIWDDKDLMIYAAISANKLGDHAKALDYANRAIALDDHSARAYFQAALAFQGMGEKRLSRENFAKAKELDREHMEP